MSQRNAQARRAKEPTQDGRQQSTATAKRRLEKGLPVNMSLADTAQLKRSNMLRADTAQLTRVLDDDDAKLPTVEEDLAILKSIDFKASGDVKPVTEKRAVQVYCEGTAGDLIVGGLQRLGMNVVRTMTPVECNVNIEVKDLPLDTAKIRIGTELKKRMARVQNQAKINMMIVGVVHSQLTEVERAFRRGDLQELAVKLEKQATELQRHVELGVLEYQNGPTGYIGTDQSYINTSMILHVAGVIGGVWPSAIGNPEEMRNEVGRIWLTWPEEAKKARIGLGPPVWEAEPERWQLILADNKNNLDFAKGAVALQEEETIKPLVAAARLRAERRHYAKQLKRMREAGYRYEADDTLVRLIAKYNGDFVKVAENAERLRAKHNRDFTRIDNAVAGGEFE